MPDLITHAAFASFFADKKYRWIFFLLAGAVLPDITRLFFLFFPDNHNAYWFFSALHSPVGFVLFSLLLVFFFAPAIRKQAWFWLLIGLTTHFGLDLLQRHLSDFSYPWFFPFSFRGTSWGLFWPEDPLYIAPFLALGAVIYYRRRRRHHKKTNCPDASGQRRGKKQAGLKLR